MTGAQDWEDRFRSRWRKFWRDPAGFVSDLPSPPVRNLCVFGLAGGTLIADALDAQDREAAGLWRRQGVELVASAGDESDFRFLTRQGRPPDSWPERVMIAAPGLSGVAVAFDHSGGVMTAAEIGHGRPGPIAIGRHPAWVRIYRTDDGERLPDRLKVRPAGRGGLVRRLREGGVSLADALKAAWPPVERRASEPGDRAYRAWIARNEPGPGDAPAIRAWLERTPALPRISVLMPVHDPRPAHLRAAIQSVRDQIHADWRLCICDDGSASEEVRRVLRQAAAGDERVRVVRHETAQGVAAASNAALALADGEVAAFLDHDDLLAPHALAFVAAAFAGRDDVAAVYSDEDSIDAIGRRSAPRFKPALDRERLLAQNYVNHLFAVRLDLLRRLGGLRPGLDGVQDHDLVLRTADSGEGAILHLPHVLYHWRIFPGGASLSQNAKATLDDARLRMIRARLVEAGQPAEARLGPRGHLLLRPRLQGPAPKVLAVVPTRDRPGLLEACVAGLLDQTDYPDLEICVVDNGSRSDRALRLLARLGRTPRVRVLRIDAPFNFAALNNAAVAGTAAELLAFVNDDVMVVEPDWLAAMVPLAVGPDVGAVGAKLFYPDGRIQHAGIVLGLGPQGVAGHEFRGAPGDAPGPQNRLLLTREVSAVTAACMVVGRRKFDEVGGFDAQAFPVAFNDVDLCLRLAQRGYRSVWTPHARLMHLESATRGTDKAEASDGRFAAEARRMRERWGAALLDDPCYNANLTLRDESFTLADRSRAPAPWR